MTAFLPARSRLAACFMAGAMALAAPGAVAPSPARGAGQDVRTSVAQPETTSQASGGYVSSVEPYLPEPLRDPLGVRPYLKDRGVEYSLTYIVDVLGNPVGGYRRGAVVEDRLNLRLNLDLDRIAGWEGATAHANAYFIHGTGRSRYYVGNLFTASVIEALPASRLYVLWLDQELLDGKLGLRAGQLAVDTEFAVSQTATLFVNSTFGWPLLHAADLPSGGPAYPVATPAVRAKYAPNANLSIQAGVYDGDPAGSAGDPATDPQRLDRSGTNFRTHDPAFAIAEAAYAYNIEKDAEGLPGTVTLGGWHHFGRFADQRFDAAGLSLADPASSGAGRPLRGDGGLYGIVDQTVYRETGKHDEGVSVFARVAVAPGDRNPFDLYLDGGFAWRGLLEGRSSDTFGVGVARAWVSDRARGLDRDAALFAGAKPVRSGETVVEATYQALVVPGFTVQPDVQYVIRPAAGAPDPRDGRRLRNAAILGVRATVQY
jgi:porin